MDFEWLTMDICKEYKKRASKISTDNGEDTKAFKTLRLELMSRCHVTEIQAYNILRGMNIRDYVNYYGILSGEIPESPKMREKREKEARKKSLEDKLKEYEDRIADLESLSSSNLSSFGFEEKD